MKILCRYILAIAGFFSIALDYLCRINISMALVPMLGDNGKNVNQSKALFPNFNETIDLEELGCNGTEDLTYTKTVTFDWTPQERGLILGAYYYGYTFFTIPAASVASRYGFKRTYGFSMFVASLLTCLFPTLVKLNLYLGVVARALLGVFHAAGFPSMVGAMGIWAPPGERSRLIGITISGLSFGSCIIFFIAGGVIKHFGWEAIFYLTGALSFIWVNFWFYLVYDSPEVHPRISTEEREYILKSLGQNGERKRLCVPWKAILTSVPVWGIVLAHTAFNWGNYTLNQQLPTYFTSILRFDLEMTGLLSSMCYVLQWIVCIVASCATDWLIKKQYFSTIRIRKANTMIAMWITGVCFVLAGYAGCNTALAIFMLLVTSGLNILVTPGCKSNVVDIAPAYSGIVFGLSNTIANIPGFVAPQVAGFILQENSVTEWQYVFWLSAGVQVLGSLLFLTTGTDKLQEWAKVENQKVAEKEITKEESGYNTDNIIPNNSADYNASPEFTKDNGDTITSQESGYFTATQNTLHNLSNIILANDGEINKTFTGEDVESQVCVQDLFENVDSTELPAVTHANAPNIDSSEQINADHSNISNVPNETSKIFEVTEIIEDEKFDNVNKKKLLKLF